MSALEGSTRRHNGKINMGLACGVLEPKSEYLPIIVVSAHVILKVSFGHETFLTVWPRASKLFLLQMHGLVYSEILPLIEYLAAIRVLTCVGRRLLGVTAC